MNLKLLATRVFLSVVVVMSLSLSANALAPVTTLLGSNVPVTGYRFSNVTASPTITPLATSNKSALTDVILVGQLVLVWGKVKTVNGTTSFTISDGYSTDVTVNFNGATPPSGFGVNKIVVVSGLLRADRVVFLNSVYIPSLSDVSSNVCPGDNWISLPLAPAEPGPSAIFGDESLIDGRLLTYLAPSGTVATYDSASPNNFGAMFLGSGYVVSSDQQYDVTYQGLEDGIPSYPGGPMSNMWISLPGCDGGGGVHWVGNPFSHDVPLAGCLVTDGIQALNLTDAANAGWINGLWSAFDASNQTNYYVGPSKISPFNYMRKAQMYKITTYLPKLALIVPGNSIVAHDNLIITASAGPGGSINPSGDVSVPYYANKTFTFSPSAGYGIASMSVDGTPVVPVTGYTFHNVTANHAISATFHKPYGMNIKTILTDSKVVSKLVKVWGRVKSLNGTTPATSFTISDGYNLSGVNVNINGVLLHPGFGVDKTVVVTGVLSASKTLQAQTISVY